MEAPCLAVGRFPVSSDVMPDAPTGGYSSLMARSVVMAMLMSVILEYRQAAPDVWREKSNAGAASFCLQLRRDPIILIKPTFRLSECRANSFGLPSVRNEG